MRGDFWLWLAGLITFHVPRLMCVDGVRPLSRAKVGALDATVVKMEASRCPPTPALSPRFHSGPKICPKRFGPGSLCRCRCVATQHEEGAGAVG
jgi:hypothetical protein